MTAFKAVTGGIRPEPDYDKTELVLFWGANPMATERYGAYAAYNGMRKIIPRLKQRGVRIVSIDPFRTGTVRQADAWITINPGSDVALGLARLIWIDFGWGNPTNKKANITSSLMTNL